MAAQEAIRWADHLLIVHPLWHGHFPAVFHAFLEQVFRPGFAVESGQGWMPEKLLKGKSARIAVTIGMPAWFYRWCLGAHSLKSLKYNILCYSGIAPVTATLIGRTGAGAALPPFERDFPKLCDRALTPVGSDERRKFSTGRLLDLRLLSPHRQRTRKLQAP